MLLNHCFRIVSLSREEIVNVGLHVRSPFIVDFSQFLLDRQTSRRVIQPLVVVLVELWRDFSPVIAVLPVSEGRCTYFEFPGTLCELLDTIPELLDVGLYALTELIVLPDFISLFLFESHEFR